MTLAQLLELLEDFTEEQLKFNFVVLHDGEYVVPSMVTFVATDTDEDGFQKGQPIII